MKLLNDKSTCVNRPSDGNVGIGSENELFASTKRRKFDNVERRPPISPPIRLFAKLLLLLKMHFEVIISEYFFFKKKRKIGSEEQQKHTVNQDYSIER